MKDNKETVLSIKEVILVSLMVLFVGIILGLFISYQVFVKTIDPKTNEFLRTYKELSAKYYQDVDEDELFAAGIKGMIDFFEDKNTNFLEKKSTDAFNNNLNGAYLGYGISFEKRSDGFYLVQVLEENIKDFEDVKLPIKIEKINGEIIKELSVDELTSMLAPTTKINIEFSDNTSVMLIKQKIEYKSVSSNKLEDDLYYLRISLFSDNTYEQLLAEEELLNAKSIILDLRNNIGGLLESVKQVSSFFSSKEEIIFKTKQKDVVETFKTTGSGNDYKLVVLVNERTASAAEVLASFLQDQKNAVLVGTFTYGKGTVQETKNLKNGSSIKFTTKEWLTSLDKSINNKGLLPDFIEEDQNEQNKIAINQIKKVSE